MKEFLASIRCWSWSFRYILKCATYCPKTKDGNLRNLSGCFSSSISHCMTVKAIDFGLNGCANKTRLSRSLEGRGTQRQRCWGNINVGVCLKCRATYQLLCKELAFSKRKYSCSLSTALHRSGLANKKRTLYRFSRAFTIHTNSHHSPGRLIPPCFPFYNWMIEATFLLPPRSEI